MVLGTGVHYGALMPWVFYGVGARHLVALMASCGPGR